MRIRPILLPELSEELESTRVSLHAHPRGISVVPRAHGVTLPKWWHVALKPPPDRLATESVSLAGGGSLEAGLDVLRHEATMRGSDGWERRWDLRSGVTASQSGDAVVFTAAERGLAGGHERSRHEDDAARSYDPASATAYFVAFTAVSGLVERHQAGDAVAIVVEYARMVFDLAAPALGRE